MIDSNAVTTVANEAHTVLNMAYVAILAVVSFVTYLIGLVRGKKKASAPAAEGQKQ